LQFTGLTDKNEEELYEMDIVLVQSEKFVIVWDDQSNGWFLTNLKTEKRSDNFSKELAARTIRLCSYFESGDAA
ncbi:MAG TPA: YopX family protein, partial [Cyclobacteriaceae bacterium]|nr:YopX family protein [Cyclobacteriaceae bacterium]